MKAHRLVYHSALGSRVMEKKKKISPDARQPPTISQFLRVSLGTLVMLRITLLGKLRRSAHTPLHATISACNLI